MKLNEDEIEAKAVELFEPLQDFALDLELDDALALAEAFASQVNNYVAALRDDVRRRG